MKVLRRLVQLFSLLAIIVFSGQGLRADPGCLPYWDCVPNEACQGGGIILCTDGPECFGEGHCGGVGSCDEQGEQLVWCDVGEN